MVTRLGLLALIVLLTGLTACGTDGPGDGLGLPQRSPEDLATVQARSGTVEASPTRRAPTRTPTPKVVVAAATATPKVPEGDPILVRTLLGNDDLPMEWTNSTDEEISGGWGFCDTELIEERFASKGTAEAKFASARNEWLFERVAWFTEADATAAMDYLRQSFTCPEYITPDASGKAMFWTFQDISLPGLGEGVTARTFSITYENAVFTPLQGVIIVAQAGPLVLQMVHIGFVIDPSQTEQLAFLAITKARTLAPRDVTTVAPPGP